MKKRLDLEDTNMADDWSLMSSSGMVYEVEELRQRTWVTKLCLCGVCLVLLPLLPARHEMSSRSLMRP